MTVINGCVGVVCVDAIFTFLTPKYGQKKEFIPYLYALVAGIECSPQIRNRFDRALVANRKKYQEISDDDERWLKINTEVYRILLPDLSEAQCKAFAAEVHERILGDLEQYEITDDSRQALVKLQQLREWGYQLVVSSNNQTTLSQLIKDVGAWEYFDKVYTSQFLQVRKPSRAFWLVIQGYRSAPVVAMIGNSLDHDGPAAKYGIDTYLIDPDGELAKSLTSGRGSSRRSNINKLYRRYHMGKRLIRYGRTNKTGSDRGALYLQPRLTDVADRLIDRLDPKVQGNGGEVERKQVANG